MGTAALRSAGALVRGRGLRPATVSQAETKASSPSSASAQQLLPSCWAAALGAAGTVPGPVRACRACCAGFCCAGSVRPGPTSGTAGSALRATASLPAGTVPAGEGKTAPEPGGRGGRPSGTGRGKGRAGCWAVGCCGPAEQLPGQQQLRLPPLVSPTAAAVEPEEIGPKPELAKLPSAGNSPAWLCPLVGQAAAAGGGFAAAAGAGTAAGGAAGRLAAAWQCCTRLSSSQEGLPLRRTCSGPGRKRAGN